MTFKHVQKFDSAAEFVAFATSPIESGLSRSSQHATRRGFNLESWDATVKHAANGWSDGRKDVERLSARLESLLSGMIPVMTVNYDVTGDWLDVGRFMTGEPEVFGTLVDSGMRVDATTPKLVRIVANVCVSGSQSPESLRMRGAAVVAMADMLERHGIRCQIDLVAANGGYDRNGESSVITWARVKEFGDSMQLDSLAFILAHPDSFRRLMFSAWEHLPDDVRTANGMYGDGGYGRVVEVDEGDERGDIYLDGFESAFSWGEKAVIAWIRKRLESQGIVLEDGE